MAKNQIAIGLSVLWLWQSIVSADTQIAEPYYPKLKFAISLLDLLQKDQPNESIFYSPHSVYQSLLLAYFGAGGETEKELENVLGVLDWAADKSAVERAYSLEKDLQANQQFQNQSIEFVSVDKLYVSDRIKIRDSAKKLLSKNLEELNFATDPDQSINRINKFVEESTKNNIKNLLIVNEATKETQIAIVNAAYFKGDWVSQFDAAKSLKGKFYKPGVEPIYVDMMHKRIASSKYGYVEKWDTEILRMPFLGENERFSMYFFLPGKTPTAIDELLENLTAPILDDVFNGEYLQLERRVSITLPKFSFEKASKLLPSLQRMGVQSLSGGSANFSNFIECITPTECMSKTEMGHKAKIDVNEKGATAAAATYGMLVLAAAFRPNVEFRCDRPFVFMIYDAKLKEILFAGTYRG